MVELVIRVVLSLGVVLGLFWMVARTGSRRLGGRDRALLRVRSRQSLSRSSSLAVVEVGSRVLVVGVGDGGIRLLTELDPADLESPVADAVVAPYPVGTGTSGATPYPDYAGAYADDFAAGYAAYAGAPVEDCPVPGPVGPLPVTAAAITSPRRASGAVGGSLLDKAVWRAAWASATGRAHRRADVDAA
jgi:flagellar protein FliO/FliZ